MITIEFKIRNNKTAVILLILYFVIDVAGNKKNSSLIYLLIWETYNIGLTSYLDKEKGQQYFTNKQCRFQNCFLTDNKTYFSDVRDFDVILFNAMTFNDYSLTFPTDRSINQKYVFLSDEPPAIHPVPSHYNGIFNLTWTYKLDSDALFRYIIIRNKKSEVIGPKRNMRWMDVNDMDPTSGRITQKFKDKKIAAAWVASHCETPSQREEYVKMLIAELNKYNLQIDIFGHCGNDNIDMQCSKGIDECNSLIESDYFFYLAFENSMSEDYVTEKLLTATKHYTVPIVYGGADYTRFLPNGSFLDAQVLGPQNLARIMNDTIYIKEKYYDFFKWHKYYSFHDPFETPETDEICSFCGFLNDKKHMYISSAYTNIKRFWIA